MPPAPRRRIAPAVIALVALTLLAPPLALPPAPALAVEPEPAPRPADRPKGIRAFMLALAVIESGGRYDAQNARTKAHGRYQILPSNWPAWAARYVGRADAPRTPAMQDRVARGRLTDLHTRYGRWDLVAYWWLTGRDGRRTRPWSATATRYVDNVMAAYRRVRGILAGRPVVVGDGSSRIEWRGGWRTARHASYGGDHARYASRSGASATLAFTGRAVSWIGPQGPTRGRAGIYLDGRYLRSIDLHARRFAARRLLFEAVWLRPGPHTLEIRVQRTPGRPVVAIDELRVRP